LVLLALRPAWIMHAEQREQDAYEFADARHQFAYKRDSYRAERERLAVLRLGQKHKEMDDKRAYRYLREAEEEYVKACRKCASAVECAQDRKEIEAGRVSMVNAASAQHPGGSSYNPCL